MVHDSVGSWSVLRSVLRAMKKRHVVQAKTRKDVQFQYMRKVKFWTFLNLAQSMFALDCFSEWFLRQYSQPIYTCFGLSSLTVPRVFIVFLFGSAVFVGQFPHSSFKFARALFR